MNSLSQKLAKTTTAVKLSFSWLGTHKALTPGQKDQAASTFGADQRFISASQKLFDTKNPAYKTLSSLKTTITEYWRTCTLPYTEDGIRLLPNDALEGFVHKMDDYRQDFEAAVSDLNSALPALKDDAAKRLGALYNPENYPASVLPFFKLEWSFPSIQPPEYLAKLAPQLYKQEQERAAARLNEAISLAEEAFLGEFKKLINNLHERLTPGADGQKKIFHASAIENLSDFFTRFKQLNIGSNQDLDAIVNQAQELIHGITPQELRDHKLLRQEIASGLGQLSEKLDPLITKAPRRHILTPKKVQHEAQAV